MEWASAMAAAGSMPSMKWMGSKGAPVSVARLMAAREVTTAVWRALRRGGGWVRREGSAGGIGSVGSSGGVDSVAKRP